MAVKTIKFTKPAKASFPKATKMSLAKYKTSKVPKSWETVKAFSVKHAAAIKSKNPKTGDW
jgi:hypothetical protein